MKIAIVEDYQTMSQKAAEMVIDICQKSEGPINICIPAGRTPLGMYQVLVQYSQSHPEAFHHVNWFTLDEYTGIPNGAELSCFYRLTEVFYKPAGINPKNIFTYNTEAPDFEEEAARYEQLIHQMGGLDFAVLGIGRNGHVGFNEPGSEVDSRTRQMTLHAKTIEQSRHYFNEEGVPPQSGITLGIGSLLESRSILLFANGQEKKDIVKQLVDGAVGSDVPASFFRLHNNAVLLLDKEAACLLSTDLNGNAN